MKLLILLLIAYLGYRGLKSWMLQNVSSGKPVSGGASGEIDDVMVKDPYCEVYFPKRNGVRIRHNGEELYFCSTQCRDKYLATKATSKETNE